MREGCWNRMLKVLILSLAALTLLKQRTPAIQQLMQCLSSSRDQQDLLVCQGRKATQDHSLAERCTSGGGGQCVELELTLVYAGRAAGTDHLETGGTSDTFCMPETPQYLSMDTAATHVSTLHGVEFETFGDSTTPFENLAQHNMPYVVCHTDTKLVVFTIPAQYSCPSGWSMEYNGYLMTELERADRQRRHHMRGQRCWGNPGLEADMNDAVVYLMKASCNGLPCPPYNSDMVLPCAVCSK